MTKLVKLKLDGKRVQLRPHISKLIVHDESGVAQFMLECENTHEPVKFSIMDVDISDMLIQSKQILTMDKGVEAFGAFLSGAEKENANYRHLLTVYVPEKDSTFAKYHITLEDKLEHLDLEDILLLATECYAVIYPALLEFRDNGIVSVENYPLLLQFFARKYTDNPFKLLLNGTDVDGTPLEVDSINESNENLITNLGKHHETIEAVDMYIMTISGAIIACTSFMDRSIENATLHQMTHSTINSPGIFTSDGISTLWYPFSKTKIGKVSRTFSTTLNTLSYASSNRDMKDQIQTNIAHKFHDVLENVAGFDEELGSYGLHTNIGHLVCSLKFKPKFVSDMSKVLEVTQEISEHVKVYGQSILSYVAKKKKFDIIMK